MALALVLIGVGGLTLLRPHFRGGRHLVAGVPTSPAFFAITKFRVPPHGQACMHSVTIDANSDLAEFDLYPAKPTKLGGPPVDLVLRAAGYHAVVKLPGGYPGGGALLPIIPPPSQAAIGTACFVNLGTATVALNGTTEARTISRSTMTLDGRRVSGDIALLFIDDRDRPLLDEINDTFGHASNLTDGLMPVPLIWVIAVLVLLAVPLGIVAAFYLALTEDQVANAELAGDAKPS